MRRCRGRWVRISSTPSMPHAVHQRGADRDQHADEIIDQPIGLRWRRGCGSASAPSSAGSGSFKGSSDKESVWR